MQKFEVGPSRRQNARSRSIKPLTNSIFDTSAFEMDYRAGSQIRNAYCAGERFFVNPKKDSRLRYILPVNFRLLRTFVNIPCQLLPSGIQ